MPHNLFEQRLIDAIQPIRFHVLATCLYHLFDTGIFEMLATANVLSSKKIAEQKKLDIVKLEAFLKYLEVEGIVYEDEQGFRLTDKGKRFAEFRPWYTLLIGGYSGTFLQIGEKLRREMSWATRDATKVGEGSCGISHYDAIPLTRTLMTELPQGCNRLLDLGCGNGLYLVEFCKEFPEIEAWGVEPDEGSYKEALSLVHQNGLENRVHILHSTASGFLNSHVDFTPDFVVLGFVLHEILGQDGEEGVSDFLTELMHRFPKVFLIVIEVDWQIDAANIMSHGLSLAYYNPYYLLHPFTRQRLEPRTFWEALFERLHLKVLKRETTDPYIDSTGLEIGYLLRRQQ